MSLIDHFYLTSFLDGIDNGKGVLQRSLLTRSIMGRDIPLVTLGKGKRAVLYVAAQQGTESVTSQILLDFITDYLKQYERKSSPFENSMDYLFRERKIYLLPMFNPDGVSYALEGVDENNPLAARLLSMNGGSWDFSRWEANARGVDLNHNFATGFEEYKRSTGILNGAPVRYSGEYPESEPETAALCRLLRAHREEIAGVLILRTQGEVIYCSCEDNLTAKSMAIGRVLARTTGYRLSRPEELTPFGGLADWCISELGRPAYTVKCGEAGRAAAPEDHARFYERLRHALFSFAFWV